MLGSLGSNQAPDLVFGLVLCKFIKFYTPTIVGNQICKGCFSLKFLYEDSVRVEEIESVAPILEVKIRTDYESC